MAQLDNYMKAAAKIKPGLKIIAEQLGLRFKAIHSQATKVNTAAEDVNTLVDEILDLIDEYGKLTCESKYLID